MNQLIKKYRMVLSAIYCLILPYSFVSYGAEAESVIRVGFPVQSGLFFCQQKFCTICLIFFFWGLIPALIRICFV